MNIQELITELQKLDPEKMVVIDGYEGGYNEVGEASPIRLNLRENEGMHYCGLHEESDTGECHAIRLHP